MRLRSKSSERMFQTDGIANAKSWSGHGVGLLEKVQGWCGVEVVG